MRGSNDPSAQQEPQTAVELWRARKGDRELVCLAVYFPTGIDVRLMEGNDCRRAQLVMDEVEAYVILREWLNEVHEGGWD